MPKCGAAHPEDPSRTCLKTDTTHGEHGDPRGIWPNAEAREQAAARAKAGKKSAKKDFVTLVNEGSKGYVDRKREEERAKGIGMSQALQATPEQFKAHFRDALHSVALIRATLTSDDVWEVLGQRGIDTENRAGVGPMMASAAKRGWIEKTEGHAVSSRPGSKARDGLTVWASLIQVPSSISESA